MRLLIRYRTAGRLRVSDAIATTVGLISCVAITWLVQDLAAHIDADPHPTAANLKSWAFIVAIFTLAPATLGLSLSHSPERDWMTARPDE